MSLRSLGTRIEGSTGSPNKDGIAHQQAWFHDVAESQQMGPARNLCKSSLEK